MAIREFSSIGAFIAHLATLEGRLALDSREALTDAAKLVEEQAKAEIGTYQPAVGPFAAWPELADSTKEDRASKGYPENEPLLRTGDLRDSISHEVHGLEAIIGSTEDVALYHELGTQHIPPRPFLGTAALFKEKEIVKLIGEQFAGTLAGVRYRIKGG